MDYPSDCNFQMEAIRDLRRIRGFTRALEEFDLGHSEYYQREIVLKGFCKNVYEHLDKVETLVKEHLEKIGNSDDAIQSLCKTITELEEELYTMRDK